MDHRTPNPNLYNVPFLADEFQGMPYRRMGRSGLRTSGIGLGTWKVGYPETGDGARVGEKEALALFDRAHDLGVTFWDTANRYNAASGNSERVIGTWMKAHPNARRDIVLATKLFGGMDGFTPNHSRLSRGNICDSVYASLERLCVPRIDLLWFHRFDAETPIEESLCAVEDLMRQDLVRYLGVSNFTPTELRLYAAAERSLTPRVRVVAVQNQYDILHGEDRIDGTLAYCARENLGFVPYSPLARGLLSNRYLTPEKLGKGDRLVDEGTLKHDLTPEIAGKLQKLGALSQAWDLDLNQLALAYMLTLPGMSTLIPSCSNVQQLESNAKAGKVALSLEQQGQVKAALA
ncbi:MAG: aldo/keto reductase [Planctomycetota bacterium]